MTIIRFPGGETEKRGLGYLIGRFSFKSWASGESMVPDEALPFLAREGVRFIQEHSHGVPGFALGTRKET